MAKVHKNTPLFGVLNHWSEPGCMNTVEIHLDQLSLAAIVIKFWINIFDTYSVFVILELQE